MQITRTSELTGKTRTLEIDVTEEQMRLWESPDRPLIQQVFPSLSPSEREFIKTGVTDQEWEDIFGSEGA